MSYKKNPKQDSGLVFSRKHVNCCKKEQGMCDDERSESEFYYPEEGNLNVSLQNEKFEASEVLNNNEYTDSQKAINSFVNAQKSKNTVKKTTSDMNNFKSCCKKIKLVKKWIFAVQYTANTLVFLFFLQPAVRTSELNITGRLPSVKPVIQDLKPNFAWNDPQTRVSGGHFTRVQLRDSLAC